MESELDWYAAREALLWQVELGVTEAIGESPVNRYALETPKRPASTPAAAVGAGPVMSEAVDPVAEAEKAARSAADLETLAAAMGSYSHCELRRGARKFVFSDGSPDARVMIVGEAPGRDEDRIGKPFVGRAGQLLDRMLKAIGLSRNDNGAEAVYITNVLPWRPPQNRDPKPEEIAMMLPFLKRHVELAAPDILVIMGNISCQALLGRRGITRLRGKWTKALERPALPMFHPAYLLRNPSAKREAWADLLELRARLDEVER